MSIALMYIELNGVYDTQRFQLNGRKSWTHTNTKTDSDVDTLSHFVSFEPSEMANDIRYRLAHKNVHGNEQWAAPFLGKLKHHQKNRQHCACVWGVCHPARRARHKPNETKGNRQFQNIVQEQSINELNTKHTYTGGL